MRRAHIHLRGGRAGGVDGRAQGILILLPPVSRYGLPKDSLEAGELQAGRGMAAKQRGPGAASLGGCGGSAKPGSGGA